MSTLVLNDAKDKKADLAGPGIGDYKELEEILPRGYRSLLTPKETQKALYQVKRYIADNLCKELNLMMVEVPLIVDVESGVNDMLDRDGSRTPVQFHISNDRNLHPIDAQVVQAATTIIPPTSISGTGSASSQPSSANWSSSKRLSGKSGK